MRNNCSIVRDILPLYAENMVSKDSAHLVRDHLKDCAKCRAEYESIKCPAQLPGADSSPATLSDEIKPLKKIMKKLNRKFYSLAYLIIVLGIFLGFSFTEGSDLMYNSLIMPAIGVFGYIIFSWRAIYKMPILLLLVNLFAYLFNLVKIDFISVFLWTFTYSMFVFIGIVISLLLHYASTNLRRAKDKILKITAFCIALLMISGVGFFANSLVGNPISKFLATQTARMHLEEKYAHTDYQIHKVSYDFKSTDYYVQIKSPTSLDGDFTLHVDMSGKLRYDDYDARVTNNENVARRLYFEYRDMVDRVFNSLLYPYNISMGFGELKFDYEAGRSPAGGALQKSDLKADKFYNVSEIARKSGYLVLYIDDETISANRAGEILLETKRLFDDAGINFYAIHFVLRKQITGDNNSQEQNSIEMLNFLYSDIYEDGLTERIIAADKAAKKYYADMDAKDRR